MANRLKELSEDELHFREMTLEGILAHPGRRQPARSSSEKLMAYVPPKQRPTEGDRPAGGGAAEQQAA